MTAERESASLHSGLSLWLQSKQRATPDASWQTGIKSVDTQLRNVFSSGSVIGLAAGIDVVESATLSSHIIATHLAEHAQGTQRSSQPSVFVISQPSAQTMLAVADLLDQRLQAQPFKTKLESTALLSGVQLLRYLSLTGLIESVVDVSAELHKSTADQDSAEHSPTILLIQSLSSTLADTNRRSGSTQTTALVTNLLRSLTHLSQTHRHLLLLVELDFEPRNHGTSTDVNRRTNPAEQAQALAPRQSNTPALPSAFSSQQGHTITLLPSTASIGCALDSGMDVIVAVHDAFGKTRAHDKEQAKKGIKGAKTAVVEVVKDRAGHHTGDWCLWVQ